MQKKKKKLNELSIEELKKIEPKLTTEVLKVFNVKNSVNSKKSYGGTSFDNIKKMIMKYKKDKMIKKIILISIFCILLFLVEKKEIQNIKLKKIISL